MPEFKNSGTGYTEHGVGSDHFKSDQAAENRAVRGGEGPHPTKEQVKESDKNPDRNAGPQSY